MIEGPAIAAVLVACVVLETAAREGDSELSLQKEHFLFDQLIRNFSSSWPWPWDDDEVFENPTGNENGYSGGDMMPGFDSRSDDGYNFDPDFEFDVDCDFESDFDFDESGLDLDGEALVLVDWYPDGYGT